MVLRYPDVVCIGAQKSATSWLYEVLSRQGQFFIPAIKEIHYYSQPYSVDAMDFGPQHRQEQCAGISAGIVEKGQLSKVDLDYLDQLSHLSREKVDDEWYAGIFSRAKASQVCMEICPSYMTIPQAGVQHLLRLNPVARWFSLSATRSIDAGRTFACTSHTERKNVTRQA